MELLANAAAADQDGGGPSPPTGLEPLQPPAGAPIHPQGNDVAQETTVESELTEKQKSARSIKPGCGIAVINVKRAWPGGAGSKPSLVELKQELERRWHDEAPLWRVPGNWDLAKVVSKLLARNPPDADAAPGDLGQEPAKEPAKDPAKEGQRKKKKKRKRNNQDSDGEAEQPEVGGKRWNALTCFPRMIEAVVQHKVEFLKRFQKPDRKELENGDRKSVWQDIAETCNDPTFKPTKLVSQDVQVDAEMYDKLSVSVVPGYIFTAGVCEKQLNNLSAKMRSAMTGFRRSGMGEMCDLSQISDDEKIALSNTEYGAKFFNFVGTPPFAPLAYCYEKMVIEQNNLLESVQAEMPASASHSSESQDRNVRGTPTLLQAGDGGRGQQWRKSIVHALEAPVTLSKSADEKRTEFYEGRLAQVKLTTARMALGEALEKQLESIESKMDRMAERTQDIPTWMSAKKDRLTRELNAMYAEVPAEPDFTADGCGAQKRRGATRPSTAAKKGKKTRQAEEAEEGEEPAEGAHAGEDEEEDGEEDEEEGEEDESSSESDDDEEDEDQEGGEEDVAK